MRIPAGLADCGKGRTDGQLDGQCEPVVEPSPIGLLFYRISYLPESCRWSLVMAAFWDVRLLREGPVP